MERTLFIVKPDGVQRGLVGEIIGRIERRGLRLVAMKFMQINQALAAQHYAVHQGKPFYDGLVAYMTSSPVVVIVWEGPNAIELVRATMGATNPVKAAPGTIRADFGVMTGRNLTHGSDSPETAAAEIALYFKTEELLEYARASESWLYE